MQDSKVSKLGLSFTDLLYGVVIGSGLRNIAIPIDDSDVLILLLIPVIADDYILYHDTRPDIPEKWWTFRVIFIIDLVVLLLWYAASLAAGSGTHFFFFFVGLFYLSTTLWVVVFEDGTVMNKMVRYGDIYMAAGSFGLAGLSAFGKMPFWLSIILFFVLFIVAKWKSWSKWVRRGKSEWASSGHNS